MSTSQQSQQNIDDLSTRPAQQSVPHEDVSDVDIAAEITSQAERAERAKYYGTEYRSLLGRIHKKIALYPKDFLSDFRSALPEIRQAQEGLISSYLQHTVPDQVLEVIRQKLLDLVEELPLTVPPLGLEVQALIHYLTALYNGSPTRIDLPVKKQVDEQSFPVLSQAKRLEEEPAQSEVATSERLSPVEKGVNVARYDITYGNLLGDIYRKVRLYPGKFRKAYRAAIPEIELAQKTLLSNTTVTEADLEEVLRKLRNLSSALPYIIPNKDKKVDELKGLEANELIHYLIALYNRSKDLDSKDRYPIIYELMRQGEVVREGLQNPGPRLWQAIRPIIMQPTPPGTSPLLTQESRTLLETFLTTSKSMNELARESNGLWSVAGIRKNLNTSLQRVWQAIPPQGREGYETAQEAMQAVITSPVKERARREKIKEGWKEEKPRQTGKVTGHNKGNRTGEQTGGRGKLRDFSPDHHTHLSEGASRRWQRQREMQQEQASDNSSI